MSEGSLVLLDAAGRRRSPATTPGYLAGRAPRNKGMQYPPDPPRPEEIIVVMRKAGQDRHGWRIQALIAVLRRGGLRISEALALNETDIDECRGSLLVRHGKGDKRREAGMDQFGSNSSRRGRRTGCCCRPDRCSA
jgi:integrase